MRISDFEKCANCGACYNTCPVNAITVNEDGLFYAPQIDETKCVSCGKCANVCPVNNEKSANEPLKAYAGWHKDEAVVISSSSGGVFGGLAYEFIKNGGIVFGAAFSDDYRAVEFFSNEEKSPEKLKKSKYVESKVNTCFQKIKKELQNGRRVLFCGTPCQVSGLYKYLGERNRLLLTCDFACGGLPSHKLYRSYICRMEDKYRSAVVNVDFRPKSHGWKRYAMKLEFANGHVYNKISKLDPFMSAFLYGKMSVRGYCLECEFSDKHLSDITLSDFWLHSKLSELDGKEGISLVLCNTESGIEALERIRPSYELEEFDVKDVTYNNVPATVSEKQKKAHNDFLIFCEENGLNSAYQKFYPKSLKEKVKLIVTNTIYKQKR